MAMVGSSASPREVVVAAIDPLIRRATIAAGRGADAGRPMLVSTTIAVPRLDPIDLHAAAAALGLPSRAWLRPAEGFGLIGIGSAWAVSTSGAARFRDAASAWTALLDGAIVAGADDGIGGEGGPSNGWPRGLGPRGLGPRGSGPVLMGGFPFAPAGRGDPVWRGFERSSLVLPRLLYTVSEHGAWLTASVVVGADPRAEAAAAELGETWARLCAATTPVPLAPTAVCLRLGFEAPLSEWRAAIVRLAGAVGRGRVDKVVLARRVDLVADSPLDVPATLRRLEATAPESTLFAVTMGERTFLGATPERLVRTEGSEFTTVAMAGSTGRGADAAADDRLAAELLASEKDREEHRVVVEMLRETLGGVADRLEVGRAPRVVRLRHVQHLVTDIGGRVRQQAGILDLVERLHPTPAVGGQPRVLALELIDEQEHLDRGWYAGPLGWLDRRGDGEFVVALRSGVVCGTSASLFAGCGIMADSDPVAEWEESRMKLRSLASALGRLEE